MAWGTDALQAFDKTYKITYPIKRINRPRRAGG